jgi:cytochrome c
MNRRLIHGLGLTLALLAASAGAALAAGDPVRGKMEFDRCTGCHVLTGPGFAGPALAGVYGRKSGAVAGFHYSKVLGDGTIVWNEQSLDAFLAAPSKFAPGTSMFSQVPDAQDRADVIAYLKTLSAPGGP